jgi:hypothetical protein
MAGSLRSLDYNSLNMLAAVPIQDSNINALFVAAEVPAFQI